MIKKMMKKIDNKRKRKWSSSWKRIAEERIINLVGSSSEGEQY